MCVTTSGSCDTPAMLGNTSEKEERQAQRSLPQRGKSKRSRSWGFTIMGLTPSLFSFTLDVYIPPPSSQLIQDDHACNVVSWMYGCMDEWMGGCMFVCMYECMDVWMGGWVDEWMNGCMYVCMDVWMCVHLSRYLCLFYMDHHSVAALHLFFTTKFPITP